MDADHHAKSGGAGEYLPPRDGNKIVGISTVEYVIIEEKTNLPSHSVSLTQLTYFIYIFFPNHAR